MEKNAKIVPFFYKKRKRTQRSDRSFEKNGCPTLPTTIWHNMESVKQNFQNHSILPRSRLAVSKSVKL